MQSTHFRVTRADVRRQTDEPQTVTVPEETFRPHLRDGGVGFGHPLGWFDLLQREDQDVSEEGERFDKWDHRVEISVWKHKPVESVWIWQQGWWDWCVSGLMLLWGLWDHPDAHRVGRSVQGSRCNCKTSKDCYCQDMSNFIHQKAQCYSMQHLMQEYHGDSGALEKIWI